MTFAKISAALNQKGDQTVTDVGVRRDGVPCRHHKTDVTTGEIIGFVEVKNFMPAFMPTKANHEALFRGDR